MSKAPWTPNGMAAALRAVSFTGHLGSIPSQGADNSLNNKNGTHRIKQKAVRRRNRNLERADER